MREFWLIGVPGEPNRLDAYENLKRVVDVSRCNHFVRTYVPPFRLCTFNKLMDLAEHVKKIDYRLTKVMEKIETELNALVSNKYTREEAMEVSYLEPTDYVRNFTWNYAKYPDTLSLIDMVSRIIEELYLLEYQQQDLTAAYNQASAALENEARKGIGQLDLAQMSALLKEHEKILETKHFTTLLIEVPSSLTTIWEKTYEHIHQDIVPGSLFSLGASGDTILYSLAMTRRLAADFRMQMPLHTKISVKSLDFGEVEEEVATIHRLHVSERDTHEGLQRWLFVSFKRAFITWVHMKYVKIYIECLVRYGVPFRFVLALVEPKPTNAKKIRSDLRKAYAHLDLSYGQKQAGDYNSFAMTKLVVSYVSPLPHVYFLRR